MSQVETAEAPNFDEVFTAPRDFILGGQRFHWVQMHWRVWGEFLDKQQSEQEEEQRKRDAELAKLKAAAAAKGEDPETVVLEDRGTVIESFEYVVKRVKMLIESSDSARFTEIIEDKDKHISIEQLQLLLVWLQEVQIPERPTRTPEPSEAGPGESAPISQVA